MPHQSIKEISLVKSGNLKAILFLFCKEDTMDDLYIWKMIPQSQQIEDYSVKKFLTKDKR